MKIFFCLHFHILNLETTTRIKIKTTIQNRQNTTHQQQYLRCLTFFWQVANLLVSILPFFVLFFYNESNKKRKNQFLFLSSSLCLIFLFSLCLFFKEIGGWWWFTEEEIILLLRNIQNSYSNIKYIYMQHKIRNNKIVSTFKWVWKFIFS